METARAYCAPLRAGRDGDGDAMQAAAVAAGFLEAGGVARHRARVDAMIQGTLTERHRPGPFDSSERGLVKALRDPRLEIAADRAA